MPGPESALEGLGEQDGLELVQRTPLFRGLTFDETRRLFAIASAERRGAGETIVEANAMGQALHRADGKGRAVACEILVSSLGIQECIRDADKTAGIKDLLEKGRDLYGTQTFDQHLTELYNAGVITLEIAKEAASNASDLERALSFE